MLVLPADRARLRAWFLPERPGPLVGLHVLATGHGACFVDNPLEPTALLSVSAGNASLAGTPSASFLQEHQAMLMGTFLEAPPEWDPLLRAAFPDLKIWDRIIMAADGTPTVRPPASVRRLTSLDAYALWGLTPQSAWISKTWGGPVGLASSGMAWGAWDAGQLVSVACTFFVGEQFEEIGVITEPGFERQGFSTACAGMLAADIHSRGRRLSWTTSPDNAASLGVAAKLGCTHIRHDQLYVIGLPIP